MLMTPMNRHIKVDIVQQAPPEAGGVLMPDDYKALQEWETGVIKEVATNCEHFTPKDVGSVVVFPGNMLVCVDALGNQYHFVQENYVVCRQLKPSS
tara:strand:- start:1430 stop:1717 length:288 start_codon:yes stop_codon:yes gene_type:complete